MIERIQFNFIRFDRKVKHFILKTKWFDKYSLFALLIIECILSWATKLDCYTWELYEHLFLLFYCSIILGLREIWSSYLHDKCLWQKTASVGLTMSGIFNLILKESTNVYLIYFESFSITLFAALTGMLIYKLNKKTNIV